MKLLPWCRLSRTKSFSSVSLVEQSNGNIYVREIIFIAKTKDGAIVAFEKDHENIVVINKSENIRFLEGHGYDASQIDYAVQKQRAKELAESRARRKDRRERKRDRERPRTL